MVELIHPRMLATLHRFFSSLCTIRSSVRGVDVVGGETYVWSDLAGHVGIRCAIAAASGGKEVKRADMSYVVATHHVTLAGYYPAITETMRAVVGGLTLDILLVEHDSQDKTTRLACQLVTR